MTHKLVKIKWIEASRANGKLTQINRLDLTGVKTVGFLIHDTDNAVTVAQSLIAGAVENIIVIPKVSIIELIELKMEEPDDITTPANTP